MRLALQVTGRAILLVWIAWAALPARAEFHALLVGVSSYPSLPDRLRLEGPRNDVQRMQQVLSGRGFKPAQVQVLADGVGGAGTPTRANILAAIDAMADRARPGDTAFIHFAGHGSRQPTRAAAAGTKEAPGGMEATFLPIDVGSWDGAQGTVRNAIPASDLRLAIDRISARGAFVWAVFDACHSATLVRGEDELRYRHVDPAELGMPASVRDRLSRHSPPGGPAPVGALDTGNAGSSQHAPAAYFYATQVHELTPELRLPLGDRGSKPYGLFSFVVSRGLERGQPMSYRQLAQFVLAEYGGLVEARATPLFSGSGLDRLVLGQAEAPIRQWALEPGKPPAIAAGTLSGIVKGAVLAVLPGPLARDNEALGHLEVVEAEASRATLGPVGQAGRPAISIDRLQAGQTLRLVHAPPPYALRAAVDLGKCVGDCPLRLASQRLQARGVPGVDMAWVEKHERPDVLVSQRDNKLVLLPSLEQGVDTGIRPAGGLGFPMTEAGRPLGTEALANRLAQALHAMARVRNLLRLSAALAARADTTGLAASLSKVASAQAPAIVVPAEQVPTLRAGDRLRLTVDNRGPVAQDLTVLYLDADHGIKLLFPNRLGESNRLEPGSRQLIDDIVIGTPPVGIERLMLIAVAARPHGERADFSFLEQPALDRQRGGGSDDLDALADAAFAAYRTRGAARPQPPSAGTTIQTYTLNVAGP